MSTQVFFFKWGEFKDVTIKFSSLKLGLGFEEVDKYISYLDLGSKFPPKHFPTHSFYFLFSCFVFFLSVIFFLALPPLLPSWSFPLFLISLPCFFPTNPSNSSGEWGWWWGKVVFWMVFFTRFASKGTFGHVWRPLWLLKLGGYGACTLHIPQ